MMSEKRSSSKWQPFATEYDPLKCGSIDGTDTQVHDKAISRAITSEYKPNPTVKGNPECTVFVAKLNHATTEQTLRQIFGSFGAVVKATVIRDYVTGFPRGYGFVEFATSTDAREAYHDAHQLVIDGNSIVVDYEHGRLMKGWKPRRLGGGFGGKKESGQLRFGCRDRPFKRPITLDKHRPSAPYRRRQNETDQRQSFSKKREHHRR
uniref:U11/U12 small nuclear ribonucleoprotein 35 kDa protein n=1 Tax=Phallusia mammillata TaxID=59560 RepID=A0A6F9DTY6_9ASCI|nr:U11/U12 small nuclear ribonucleoprotein 35 kDa protein-like [Phallusia mammillata]